MDALQGAIDVDTNIFFSINRMHNMYFDYFMSAYSGKWVWIPMYAAIWYVMLRNFHWKVTLFCMIGLALTITFADQACATWIRPYVERMRPSNLNNPISEMVHIVNNHRGGRYGFPSCHAANTFGLAFFLFFLFRKRWLALFIMAWALLTFVPLNDTHENQRVSSCALLVSQLIHWLAVWVSSCDLPGGREKSDSSAWR